MKDGFIEEIRSKGYWRINFRPTSIEELGSMDLAHCSSSVQNAAVGLRGWDYPHFPHQQEGDSGIEKYDDFVQGWIDWMDHREFWRMYTSSQFIHYRALDDDWIERDRFGVADPRKPAGPGLGAITSLWLIAEIFEFLSRLSQSGLYKDGADVSLQLHSGQEPRNLYIDDIGRFPFSHDRKTHAEKILLKQTVSAAEMTDPRALALRVSTNLFDRFGWNPRTISCCLISTNSTPCEGKAHRLNSRPAAEIAVLQHSIDTSVDACLHSAKLATHRLICCRANIALAAYGGTMTVPKVAS